MDTEKLVKIIASQDFGDFPDYNDGSKCAGLVCTLDISRAANAAHFIEVFSRVFHALKKFEGKKIKSVTLDSSVNVDVTSEMFNPLGNVIRIKVKTK